MLIIYRSSEVSTEDENINLFQNKHFPIITRLFQQQKRQKRYLEYFLSINQSKLFLTVLNFLMFF